MPKKTAIQPNSPFADDDVLLGTDDLPGLGGDEVTLIPDAEGDDADSEVPTVEDAEAEAEAEVSQALTGFKARASQENQRFEDATDSEYWVALCFQTRDQKEEFLRKMGWLELGDKYLDGMLCAEASRITLEARIPPLPDHHLDRRYIRLSLTH